MTYYIATYEDQSHSSNPLESAGSRIRLIPDHPKIDDAKRVVASLGGICYESLCVNVYKFMNTRRRDTGLEFLRSMLGWTVAEPYCERTALPSLQT
jgi:hypothetical protein